MKKLAFFILIVFLNNLCPQDRPQDQRSPITGLITDKTTGQALPDVNIYVSGTNIGIVSDQNGYYEIKQLPLGKQKLTFSLIGYESVSVTFDVLNSSAIKYDVELIPRIYSTETVEIKSERPLDRPALLSSFKELFLGVPANSRECIIEDESKIRITGIRSGLVRFSSDSMLTIRNNYLGYEIQGPLVYFDLNTGTHEYNSYFEPRFRELIPGDSAAGQKWAANRKMAFKGSLKHFLKALFSNSVNKEGFQVYYSNPEIPGGKPVELKDLSSILSPKDPDEKLLHFEYRLIVRYGLDLSSIRLRRPEVAIERNGQLKENSPFELSGSFVSKGISKLLPENYDPEHLPDTHLPEGNGPGHFTDAGSPGKNPSQYDLISDFMDTLVQFKGRDYEALKDSVQRLTFRYPKNSIFKLKYAAVLERCCMVSAEHEYMDAAEEDPKCAEAFYRLGKIQAEEFNEYRTSVKKMDVPEYVYDTFYGADDHPDPGNMLGSLKKESMEMFSDAEDSFKKALLRADNLAPDEYYLSLAFLYEDNGDYQKAIDLLDNLVKKSPGNKYAHLFLGMLYYRTRAYRNSHNEYEEAMSLMSADEKNDFMFTSVKMLIEPAVAKGLDKVDDITLVDVIRKFWQEEDPLLLTGYNERLLEHYSRVAYANLRFGNRKKSKPGWKTERGEILIRYGFPKSIVRYRPYADLGYRLTTFTKTEIWYYGGKLDFCFSDPFLTGDYPLNAPFSAYVKSQFETDSREFAGKLKKLMFESYDFRPEGDSLKGAFSIYQFKNFSERPARKTDLFMSMFIPGTDPAKVKKSQIKWGFYCFDSRYNLLESRIDSLQQTADGNDPGRIIVHNITDYPQQLNIAGEILRDPDNSAYSSHKRIMAKDFSSENRLMLSDIVISPKVVFGSGSQSAINRSGIWILPDPAQAFSKNDSVHIYYEVYNLGRNARGINDYEQDITIGRKDEKGSSIFGEIVSGAVKFFKSKDEAKKIAPVTKLISHNKNHQMIFQTNFSTLEKGDYIFRVELKDKITGQKAESETEFSVK